MWQGYRLHFHMCNKELLYVQGIETFRLWCRKTVIYDHAYLNTSIHGVLRVEWKAPFKHKMLLFLWRTNFLALVFSNNASSFFSTMVPKGFKFLVSKWWHLCLSISTEHCPLAEELEPYFHLEVIPSKTKEHPIFRGLIVLMMISNHFAFFGNGLTVIFPFSPLYLIYILLNCP